MVSERGREIHRQAEVAREKEQDFLKSLQLLDEALLAYQADGDLRGLTEALQSKGSAYKHLYQQTGDSTFLTLAKHEALAGIEIAEKLGDSSALTMVYRGLGKVLEQLEDWEGAADNFSKALEAFEKAPPAENNRPSVASDMKAHLGYDLYMSGKKQQGLETITEAIGELEADKKEDKYNIDVWLSGAHMRAAHMLYRDNPDTARNHLQKAEKIIQSNEELTLRSEQLKKLKASFQN